MNVTQDDLRAYIETFEEALRCTADQCLPDDVRGDLLHLSLLPAHIIGYVSTQFGVAIEYERAESTSVGTTRGSDRIEHLLLSPPRRVKFSGPVLRIAGCGTGIAKLTVSGAFPFLLINKRASLAVHDVAFEAGSWRRYVFHAEVYGDRSLQNWTREKAIERANQEVLLALLEVRRAEERSLSIKEYIANNKTNTVLVLGDYSKEGMARLLAIKRVLRGLGYEPFLVKDIPDDPLVSLPQKVTLLGSISRFVVIDDSSASGHLAEFPQCKTNDWITVVLRAGGRGASFMTAGVSHYSKVVLEQPYDPFDPETGLIAGIRWAEATVGELRDKLDRTYPWRAPNEGDAV